MNNLPVQLTRFVGRQHETAEVMRLLSVERLVTLTGTGGCGKTRLALQVAANLMDTYDDGVWLVELAPVSDLSLVPQVVAVALGVREQSNRSILHSLAEYLFPKKILVVLDNCEHLVSACAQLVDALLHDCPNLQILATSREALNIAGENAWTVPSLSLPDVRETGLHFRDLSQYEAIQLFVERAVAVQPGFKLTDLNAPAVAWVCQRLDGIPLAIELAAARIKVLQSAEIAARLDDRFSLLTTASRSVLPQHQTLRAAMDWSYNLLSEPEQVLLYRLAVFSGGCTLAAAEQVCVDDLQEGVEGNIGGLPILDLLSHLVDKSLLTVDKQSRETRFRMLETIREYAREKLQASGEEEELRNRHLDFFLKLAEVAEQRLRIGEQIEWLNRLEREHDNLRAALGWSRTAAGKAITGLRLAGALAEFWNSREYWREGRAHLSAMLSLKEALQPTAARAKALTVAGKLAYRQSDYPETRNLLQEGISIYRELDPVDQHGLAEALIASGDMQAQTGNYAAACSLLEEALHMLQALQDTGGAAEALWQLGVCALQQGNYQQAVMNFEESLPLLKQAGHQYQLAIVLTGLSEAALRQGDYERAAALEEESLGLRRDMDDKWGIAVSIANFGWLALCRDDLKRAEILLRESLDMRREIGDKGGMAWCLEKLAAIAVIHGQRGRSPRDLDAFQRAARLFSAAAALRAPMGSVVDLVDRPEHERQLSVVHQRLGVTNFEVAWVEGQAMTLDQVISYPMTPASPKQQPVEPETQLQILKKDFGALTRREQEVAVHVARGETNREIAEALIVSERTVESHVTNILNKLGFSRRTQIRKWVLEKE